MQPWTAEQSVQAPLYEEWVYFRKLGGISAYGCEISWWISKGRTSYKTKVGENQLLHQSMFTRFIPLSMNNRCETCTKKHNFLYMLAKKCIKTAIFYTIERINV